MSSYGNLEAEAIDMSLAEYIRKKNIVGRFDFSEKKRINIDKDELDESLDSIILQNEKAKTIEKRHRSRGSKFDRFDKSEDEEDEDDRFDSTGTSNHDCNNNGGDDDVEMTELATQNSSIQFAKRIEKMDHPDCCFGYKEFRTIEQKQGIKIHPQQWRLHKENLDRPEGVPRLITTPVNSGSYQHLNKVQSGRVVKKIKKDDCISLSTIKTGKFIKKGNFTYNFQDNDADDEDLTGIVRINKGTNGFNRNRRPYYRNNNNNQQQELKLNMDWSGFFKGVSELVNDRPKPLATTFQQNGGDVELKIAAKDLFNVLVNKRNAETIVKRNESEDEETQDCKITFRNEIISARAGEGIDISVKPKTTNMPLNLRFE